MHETEREHAAAKAAEHEGDQKQKKFKKKMHVTLHKRVAALRL